MRACPSCAHANASFVHLAELVVHANLSVEDFALSDLRGHGGCRKCKPQPSKLMTTPHLCATNAVVDNLGQRKLVT